MKIDGIQCDVCNKQHLFDMKAQEHTIPTEWVTLFHGNPSIPLRSGSNFCSLKCLYAWISNQITASDIER